MAETGQQTLYRFGAFVLDTSRGVLLENDAEVTLRPQSMMVLQVLLENHGRLVTKEELHDRVWGQKAVTDDSLAQCLVEIRRALHDTDRQLVRTLPKRGYSFDADVIVELAADRTQGAATSSRRTRHAAVLAGVLLAAWLGWSYWAGTGLEPSIAVLPFDDLSAAQDLQFVGDGLAEDILNTLAHHPEISVIARTSSFAYSTGSNDIKTIGQALDVEYVVEGSVREGSDGSFRVVAQLIETDGGTHVWSEAFDVAMADLAAVHERISNEVWLRIAPEAATMEARAVVPGFTSDELILIARHSERELRDLNEIDPELLATAIQRYRNATEVNPDSARAHAGLARVLLVDGDLPGAKLAIEAAVAAGSHLSEVHEVLGRYLWLTGQPGAGAAWEKAVELGPNNADAMGSFGYWVWIQGGIDVAEPYLVRALHLDPGSLSRYADLGNYLGNEARFDEVEELMEQIQQRFDSAEGYRVIAHLLNTMNRVDESIAWLVRARDKDPDNPVYSWALAELFADIGDYETAIRLDPGPGLGLLLKMARYPEFIDAAEDQLFEDPGDLALRYMLAFAYNATGEHRLAIWQLDRVGVRNFIEPEIRQSLDLAAIYTWIDAKFASGQGAEAQETVDYLKKRFPGSAPNLNWWRHFNVACMESALGSDEAALQELDLIAISPGLPPLYLVRDAHCLQKFSDNPRFIAVIENIEARQEAIRRQVPATLEAFGVDLPEMAGIQPK
ncbi:MAG: winged helix-turn-helix domain-containing protein [Woeseiaceae bacterium]|nr:winged helix-turn-helix domain-containing protein [Woeseiaceae bacterium]